MNSNCHSNIFNISNSQYTSRSIPILIKYLKKIFSILEAAKKLGRKSKVNSAKKLLANGVLPKDVANNLGVSLTTLYRWIPTNQE